MLDLVDEMQWENVVEFVSLEDAGLEEPDGPIFGLDSYVDSAVHEYVYWMMDGDREYELFH